MRDNWRKRGNDGNACTQIRADVTRTGSWVPAAGIRLGAALTLAVAAAAAFADALADLTRIPPAPGDFDASGTVDMADHQLFREAFGGADSLYDLNGDGRVDLEDFYALAELIRAGEGQPTQPTTPEVVEGEGVTGAPPEPLYALSLTGKSVRITFPDYTIEVSHGSPFGITSATVGAGTICFRCLALGPGRHGIAPG